MQLITVNICFKIAGSSTTTAAAAAVAGVQEEDKEQLCFIKCWLLYIIVTDWAVVGRA
jgi:hypothetical protein